MPGRHAIVGAAMDIQPGALRPMVGRPPALGLEPPSEAPIRIATHDRCPLPLRACPPERAVAISQGASTLYRQALGRTRPAAFSQSRGVGTLEVESAACAESL
ncbi:hypothetical protein [Rhizorhapis sp. SPR117]|uniref:hypothetical protein n=1 Tax=Rhizorhapis sp. SPR117 TaxID=2912611 RepID=UPI001F20A0F1|nr:hypothetical protein [Rhizorhapis sp. SPR117]